jgi:hypothetical protein
MLQISLLFTYILPLLATLPVLYRLRAARAAQRRGLLRQRGWHWLLRALAASAAMLWLAQAALVYRASPALPAAALAALGVMLAGAYLARRDLHPGLRGFRRSLPRDGLEIIERETQRPPIWRRALLRLRPVLTLLPALLVLGTIAAHQPNRWPGFALLALLLPAPLLLVPWRWQWLLPAGMALPLALLLSQAAAMASGLPAGSWAWPISGARCPGVVRAAPEQPRAWCADARTGRVYAIDLPGGRLAARADVSEAARVFAASGSTGWVQQIPAHGLVRVTAEGRAAPEPLRVNSAHQGAADIDGRLWVIDVSRELTLFEPGHPARPLGTRDGLLNATANVVRASPRGDIWVGGISGLSRLRRGSSTWETIDRQQGVPGAVLDFAFGPDGAVWLLWQERPGYGAQTDWGASRLLPDGTWLHLPLGTLTQLDVPRSEAPLAVDGQGRLWFATQSLPRRVKVLGIVAPAAVSAAADADGTGGADGANGANGADAATQNIRVALYPLGAFETTGLYVYGGSLWRDTYGVAADGTGGVLVFSGPAGEWMRWR